MTGPQLALVAPSDVLVDIGRTAGSSIQLIELESWLAAYAHVAGGPGGSAMRAGSLEILNTTIIGVVLTASMAPEQAAAARELAAALAVPVHAEASDGAGREPVSAWIFEQIAGRLLSAQRAATLDRAASARIRRDFMALERDFSDVEDFLYGLGAPRFAVGLDVAPAGGEIHVPGRGAPEVDGPGSAAPAGTPCEITQVLPVSPRALAAIDLHVTTLPRAEGSIEVDLVDAGGAPIAAAGRRSLVSMRLGANRFAFETGVRGPDQEACLRVRVNAPPGATFGLATGPATAVPRFAPRLDGQPAGDDVLAMKLWRGLPGISLQPLAPSQGTLRRFSLRLPADLPEPRVLTGTRASAGSSQAGDGAAIVIRPPGDGPAVAIVPGLDVEGLLSVSASVRVPHALSPTLGFAIAAVPAGEADRLPEPATVLGNWLLVPARGWGEVHYHLERPFTGKLDLVLAVSITAPADSRAYGAFNSFRFGLSEQ